MTTKGRPRPSTGALLRFHSATNETTALRSRRVSASRPGSTRASFGFSPPDPPPGMLSLNGSDTVARGSFRMKAPAHIVGGALAGGSYGALLVPDGPSRLLLLALACFAALLPDIDHPRAALSRALPPLRWLYRISLSNPLIWGLVALLTRRGLRDARQATRDMVGHRALTHSLPGAALFVGAWWGMVVLVLGLFESQLGSPEALLGFGLSARVFSFLSGVGALHLMGAFAAGYASHIALDMLTRSGVPLLMPFRRTRHRLLPRALTLRTGEASRA